MSTLYEYYNTGDDATRLIEQAVWGAQTFTPSEAHTITSVKLKLRKTSAAYDPGTITISIKATDGSGHPVDGDLCSGTILGSDITTTPTWYEISLGAGHDLDADTKYAIVVRAPDAPTDEGVKWRYDSSGEYDGGCREHSTNSGSSWTSYTDHDFMFEEWGEEIPVVAPTVTTQEVSDIAPTTATGNGTIVDDGGETPSAWGVCYNTTGNPTTADDVAAGSGAGGIGAFTAPMTGLTPEEHYYVKAYATNTEGTGYGDEVEFDTTAAGWTGKISGVTNPAKIMGVAVANIAKVKGVA